MFAKLLNSKLVLKDLYIYETATVMTMMMMRYRRSDLEGQVDGSLLKVQNQSRDIEWKMQLLCISIVNL